MANGFTVNGKVNKDGVIVLAVSYGPEFFLQQQAGAKFSQVLLERYRELLDTKKEEKEGEAASCVVDIQSEISGSALVRGLFDLWKEVAEKKGGKVICANHPPDYFSTLTILGLPSLRNFILTNTKAEALQQLTTS